MKRRTIDNEREFDWGKTSQDYAVYRVGYPESFYEVLDGRHIKIRRELANFHKSLNS